MGRSEVVIPQKHDIVVDFEQRSSYEKILVSFLNDKKSKRLIIHSKNIKQLKKSFFGLFKTIDAAGGFVLNHNDELLVIKRFGLWDLPKGKVEKNETIKEAAIREVEEETGVTAAIIHSKPLKTYHLYYRKEKMMLKTTCWYAMKSINCDSIKPQNEEDIEDALFIPLEKARPLFDASYHSLKDLMKQYFRKFH